MNTPVVGRVAALIAALVIAVPSAAITIGGGGSKSTDCLLALQADANYPVGNEKQVRCIDGDSSCDADGTVNGVCTMRVAVCANSTYAPADCTLSGLSSVTVEHAIDTPTDPKFDPDFLALQSAIDNHFNFPANTADDCTGTVLIRVNIKGPYGTANACSRQKKKLKIRSLSTSGPQGTKEDKDTLKLYCDPAPSNGCDPQTLYTSTYDRIQKQIFNQNCAVSGCHDSSQQAGNLLLETGSSYSNLVSHACDNDSAATHMPVWLRVDPGSSDTSFLVHKLEGDLPDSSYGLRMPRNRPKLNGTLRDIVDKWISAGAPPPTPGTWVPGTF